MDNTNGSFHFPLDARKNKKKLLTSNMEQKKIIPILSDRDAWFR